MIDDKGVRRKLVVSPLMVVVTGSYTLNGTLASTLEALATRLIDALSCKAMLDLNLII